MAADTLIYLQGEGDTIVDSSSYGRTISVYGDAVTSSEQFYSGSKSINLLGWGSYLTAPSSADFTFGEEDFLIETSIYLADDGNLTIASQRVNDLNIWGFIAENNPIDELQFIVVSGGVPSIWIKGVLDSPLEIGNWYKLSVERVSDIWYLKVNDVDLEVELLVGNYDCSIPYLDSPLYICASPTIDGYFLYGYLDEFKITLGSEEVPPETEKPIKFYTISSNNPIIISGRGTPIDVNTQLLLHLDDTGTAGEVIDSSDNNIIMSYNVGYTVKTSDFKFGGGCSGSTTEDGYKSGLFYSNRTLNNVTQLGLGTNNFVIDFWFKPLYTGFTSFYSGAAYILSVDKITAPQVLIWRVEMSNRKIAFSSYDTQLGQWTSSYITTTQLTLDEWTHIALIRSGSNFGIYFNGVSQNKIAYQAISNDLGSVSASYTSQVLCHAIPNGTNYSETGPFNIDEVSIRIGTDGNWYGGFTPPDTAYGEGSNNPLIFYTRS